MGEGVDVGGIHRRFDNLEDELRKNTEALKGLSRVVYSGALLSQALLDRFTEPEKLPCGNTQREASD